MSDQSLALAVSRVMGTVGLHGKRLERLETLESVVGDLWSPFLALAGLRGLWLPGSADNTGAVYDYSGQGRTLTYNGNPKLDLYNGLVPNYDLDGTGDFFSRPHEAGLYVSGAEPYIASALNGLTLGGWFYWDAAIAAGDTGLVSKYTAAGNQRSYMLYTNGTDSEARFIISGDGAATVEIDSTVVLAPGTWYFIWGRYIPSISMTVAVNGTLTQRTTSVPATPFNSNSVFNVGGFGGGSVNNCRWALTFLCATALPDNLLSYLYARTRGFFGV